MDIAYSVNDVPIRLTDERWNHIVSARDELAGYDEDCLHVIEDPDFVLRGQSGSLKAVKGYGKNRYLVVIYREVSSEDGFVVTAYFVPKIKKEEYPVATLTSPPRRKALRGALALAQQVAQFPASKLWLDFDEEADVLYISLKRPQKATETVETDDGFLLHYRDKQLVGITVLDASKR